MVVQLLIDGASYNLPKYTIGIANRMTDINETAEFNSKAQKMYDFVSDIIGKKEAKTLIGDNIEDIDLLALLGFYDRIDNAYASAIRNTMYDQDELNEVTAAIEKLGGIDNVITLLNALNK